MTKIIYFPSKDEWIEYPSFVEYLVKDFAAHEICDVGGGANPVLPLSVVKREQLDYTILDISRQELEKASNEYKKLVLDIETDNFNLLNQFDFVITKMMAEHVRSGKLFHQNIFSMLQPGGVVIHYFPTLFALPFLVNRLIPEWFSSYLLDVFSPRNRFQTGKFPAYYSWCFGPTNWMLRRFREIGYEILEYRGYLGSKYYYRFPVVRELHKVYSRFLARHPNPYLTSYAQVILRKPKK